MQPDHTSPDSEDRAAFERLFSDYAPRLMGFFMRRGSDPTVAEELTQEVMLTVWTKAKMYDPAKAPLSTWVFTIARNKHIDAQRRMRRPEPDPQDPCFSGGQPPRAPDASSGAAERRRKLRAALRELSAERREILEKIYFEGRTMAQIAEELGVPLGTVKSRARRGLDALRSQLTGEDDHER